MTDLLIADVNNSRQVTDWVAYRKWSPVIIAKMTEGQAYLAPSFNKHRKGAQAAGLRAFGAYHFWTPGVSPELQAANAIRALGSLRDDEWLILDVETGSEFKAYERFCEITDAEFGKTTWMYGGRQMKGKTSRPLWVARYKDFTPNPKNQPGIGEILWQFSDKYPIPGVGNGDCSVFRGTVDEFVMLITGAQGGAVALDKTDIKNIGDEVVNRLGVDSTHRYTGESLRRAVDALKDQVDALAKTIHGMTGGDASGEYTMTVTRK